MQATGQGGTGGASQAATTYRTMRSRHAGAVLGDINVTPLVDVVLVLLLVFMVTAPMMSRGIDVSLPVANQAAIEVAYATSHALADIGRTAESHALASKAKETTDTLVADVRTLALSQGRRAEAQRVKTWLHRFFRKRSARSIGRISKDRAR